MSLDVCPITLREANAFVEQHHRHHGPARGCIACVAVVSGGDVVGVAIMGRPVARELQDGYTAEVTRCCTDGTQHVASKLYGALWRAARALGYRRLVTYTLASEKGASLRGAGFQLVGSRGEGRSWNSAGRPRVDTHPMQEKIRWEVAA